MIRRRFSLTLTDAGTPQDADVMPRLRAALKRLLRAYGFRAGPVVELPPEPKEETMPESERHPVCVQCGASIRWAYTPAAKPVALDPEPCDEGGYVLEGGYAVALTGLFQAREGQARYRAHHQSCPQSPPWEEPS